MGKLVLFASLVVASVFVSSAQAQCWVDTGFFQCPSFTTPCEQGEMCEGSYVHRTGETANTVREFLGPFEPEGVNGAALDATSYEVFCEKLADCEDIYDAAGARIGCGPNLDQVNQFPFADAIAGYVNYDRPCARDTWAEIID